MTSSSSSSRSSTTTTSRLCLTALILSSGLCLSEAFSQFPTTTIAIRQQPYSAYSTSLVIRSVLPNRRNSDSLHRVPSPNSNNESRSQPHQRRRQRPQQRRRSVVAARVPLSPRTSSTATRATSRSSSAATTTSSTSTTVRKASSTANTTTNKGRNSKTITKKRRNNNNNNKERVYTTYQMLDHELLTKEQEHQLGRRVQRAITLRESITVLLQAKEFAADAAEIQKERDRDTIKFHQFESLELQQQQQPVGVDYNDDWSSLAPSVNHMAVYGTTTSQAMEDYLYYTNEDENEEDFFYQDPRSRSDTFSIYTESPRPLQEGTELPASQHPWLDALFQHNQQQQQKDLAGIHLLSDEDIVQTLNVKGGRNELRSILLEGALARDKLISCNLRLVQDIAKKWTQNSPINPENRGQYQRDQSKSNSFLANGGSKKQNPWNQPTMEEAIQEGVMGLAQAAERFDPNRGLRFATFATFWVQRFVRVSFQRQATAGMRVPPRYHDIKSKYYAAIKSHYRRNGGGVGSSNTEEVPGMDVLAKQFGISASLLSKVLQLTQPVLSIDSPVQSSQVVSAGGKAGGGTADEGGDSTIGSKLAWYVLLFFFDF